LYGDTPFETYECGASLRLSLAAGGGDSRLMLTSLPLRACPSTMTYGMSFLSSHVRIVRRPTCSRSPPLDQVTGGRGRGTVLELPESQGELDSAHRRSHG
jgi:hypothetical protein